MRKSWSEASKLPSLAEAIAESVDHHRDQLDDQQAGRRGRRGRWTMNKMTTVMSIPF